MVMAATTPELMPEPLLVVGAGVGASEQIFEGGGMPVLVHDCWQPPPTGGLSQKNLASWHWHVRQAVPFPFSKHSVPDA
jgi:hypothetical protein